MKKIPRDSHVCPTGFDTCDLQSWSLRGYITAPSHQLGYGAKNTALRKNSRPKRPVSCPAGDKSALQ